MRRSAILATLLSASGLLASAAASAQNINPAAVNALSNSGTAFRALSEDLGAALSFKPMIPTENLGITGFDVGVGITQTKLAHDKEYGAALENDSKFYLPTARVHKGLPFGIDVGVAYGNNDNYKYVGGELRYALLEGGVATPAIAIRGSATKASGVDGLTFNTKGLDLSISKGILMLKPYAGIGAVWVKSEFGNFDESFSLNKTYAGVGFSLLLLNFNVEADRTGDATSYSAKVALRF